MLSVHIEHLGDLGIYVGLGIEVLTAFFLGGLIGLDRERKMKAAGIKTNILICIGSTLYTAVSLLNFDNYSAAGGAPIDPNRIAAQIVSGIGFLGAGAIIQGKGGVRGLTTAATIWVVAAIGVTIGSGFPLVATIFTLSTLVVLNLLNPLYALFLNEKQNKHYNVSILSRGKVKSRIKKALFSEEIKVLESHEDTVADGKRILSIVISVHPRKIDEIILSLKSTILVEKVNFHEIEYSYESHMDDDDDAPSSLLGS